MKVLLFSDLHLDTHFRWALPEAAKLRRRNLRETLVRITTKAAELGVDVLCCGGDLYETERFSPDTGNFLREQFAALHPLPVLLAPGNHDWFGPASLYHQVEWSPNVKVFTETAFEPVELADGFTIWGAAHRAPAATPNLLEAFRVDRGGTNVALFHGSELGGFEWQHDAAKIAHAPFRQEQVASAGFDHALLGHFHRPVARELFTYPGNPDPLEFGEDGERGAVLFDFGSNSLERHALPVACSTVEDVDVDITGVRYIDEARAKARDVLADHDGFVRLTLHGEVDEDVDVDVEEFRADVVAPHLDALVARIGAITVSYDLESLEAEQSVRGQFVRTVLDSADLEVDQRRRVLVTGLRALAGRSDLDVP